MTTAVAGAVPLPDGTSSNDALFNRCVAGFETTPESIDRQLSRVPTLSSPRPEEDASAGSKINRPSGMKWAQNIRCQRSREEIVESIRNKVQVPVPELPPESIDKLLSRVTTPPPPSPGLVPLTPSLPPGLPPAPMGGPPMAPPPPSLAMGGRRQNKPKKQVPARRSSAVNKRLSNAPAPAPESKVPTPAPESVDRQLSPVLSPSPPRPEEDADAGSEINLESKRDKRCKKLLRRTIRLSRRIGSECVQNTGTTEDEDAPEAARTQPTFVNLEALSKRDKRCKKLLRRTIRLSRRIGPECVQNTGTTEDEDAPEAARTQPTFVRHRSHEESLESIRNKVEAPAPISVPESIDRQLSRVPAPTSPRLSRVPTPGALYSIELLPAPTSPRLSRVPTPTSSRLSQVPTPTSPRLSRVPTPTSPRLSRVPTPTSSIDRQLSRVPAPTSRRLSWVSPPTPPPPTPKSTQRKRKEEEEEEEEDLAEAITRSIRTLSVSLSIDLDLHLKTGKEEKIKRCVSSRIAKEPVTFAEMVNLAREECRTDDLRIFIPEEKAWKPMRPYQILRCFQDDSYTLGTEFFKRTGPLKRWSYTNTKLQRYEVGVVNAFANCQPLINRRIICIKDIFTTEEAFLGHLRSILEDYKRPMELKSRTVHLAGPVLTAKEMEEVFSCNGRCIIRELFAAHQIFLDTLTHEVAGKGGLGLVGELFVRYIDSLLLTYVPYTQNFVRARAILANIKRDPKRGRYRKFIKKQQSKTGCEELSSLLLKPFLRISRYGLLLKALHKHTPDDHEDKQYLTEAITKIHQKVLGLEKVYKRSSKRFQIVPSTFSTTVHSP